MRRRVAIRSGAAAIAGLLLVAAVAWAAGLGVSAQPMGVYSSAASIPLTTCTPSPAADAYTAESLLDTNHGTSTEMYVTSTTLSLGNRRSWVRFDVGSCGIPSVADIRSAKVRLRITAAPSSSRTYLMHRVTSAWTELDLTWATEPSLLSTPTTTLGTGTTSGVWLEFDVLGDVRAFVDGSATNHGWRVRDDSESTLLVDHTTAFATREHADPALRPQLVVSYYP